MGSMLAIWFHYVNPSMPAMGHVPKNQVIYFIARQTHSRLTSSLASAGSIAFCVRSTVISGSSHFVTASRARHGDGGLVLVKWDGLLETQAAVASLSYRRCSVKLPVSRGAVDFTCFQYCTGASDRHTRKTQQQQADKPLDRP